MVNMNYFIYSSPNNNNAYIFVYLSPEICDPKLGLIDTVGGS